MPSCAVPTCAGQDHQVIPFPQHSTLKIRWVRAIVAGTGLDLPARHLGTVCGWHFDAGDPDDGYREPVRFLHRNGKVVSVASCRFCQRFDDREDMVTKDQLLRSADLSYVIREVFRVILSEDDLLDVVCKRCNSRLASLVHWINEWKVREDEYRAFELAAGRKRVRINRTKSDGFVTENGEVQPLVEVERLEHEEDPLQFDEEHIEYQEIEEEVVMPEPMVLKVEVEEEQILETIEESLLEPIKKFNHPPNKPAKRGRPPRSEPPPQKLKFRDILARKCYICNTLLESHEYLAAHLATEHPDRSTFNCTDCNKSFKVVTSFNRHLGFHDQEHRRQKCHFCPVRFSHIYSLVRHENRHHGTTHEIYQKQKPPEKNVKCPRCEKSFHTNYDLEDHDRFVHQKLPGATCKLCGKHFRNRSSLNKHHLVHTGDKPFECEQCEAAFKSTWRLINHVARVHGAPEGGGGTGKETKESSDEEV